MDGPAGPPPATPEDGVEGVEPPPTTFESVLAGLVQQQRQSVAMLTQLQDDVRGLNNKFTNPDSEKVVRRLTVKLGAYAKRHNDPYAADPQIKADMAQALGQAQ